MFMNRINNARNPLQTLAGQLSPQAASSAGPGVAPPNAAPQPIGTGAADAGAAGAGGYKMPQPVPYGPTSVGSPLKTGGVPAVGSGAPDPSKGLTDWIRHYGSQSGADPSVLNDTPYWEKVIGENMAKNGGNLDQDYWSYRMTSDPNKGTGYYADRNSGKTPYDGGMLGTAGAALSGLLGGMTASPGVQGGDIAQNGQGITANANSQLQALLAQLMGGR